MLRVYSSSACPKCKVLKMKLDKAGIKYEVCEDMEEMKARGIKGIPTMDLDGELLPFSKENLDRVCGKPAAGEVTQQ